MIGFIRGILEMKSQSSVLVDVEGVGYTVTIPAAAYQDLPPLGAEIKLFTHLQVKDDTLELYGFTSPDDRALFLQLMSVTDVGPRTAMNVISGMGAEALREAVRHQDVAALTQVHGVGRKTAERLLLELKDKIGFPLTARAGSANGGASPFYNDVMEALMALGYAPAAIREAMRKAGSALQKDQSVQEGIKLLLRYLS